MPPSVSCLHPPPPPPPRPHRCPPPLPPPVQAHGGRVLSVCNGGGGGGGRGAGVRITRALSPPRTRGRISSARWTRFCTTRGGTTWPSNNSYTRVQQRHNMGASQCNSMNNTWDYYRSKGCTHKGGYIQKEYKVQGYTNLECRNKGYFHKILSLNSRDFSHNSRSRGMIYYKQDCHIMNQYRNNKGCLPNSNINSNTFRDNSIIISTLQPRTCHRSRIVTLRRSNTLSLRTHPLYKLKVTVPTPCTTLHNRFHDIMIYSNSSSRNIRDYISFRVHRLKQTFWAVTCLVTLSTQDPNPNPFLRLITHPSPCLSPSLRLSTSPCPRPRLSIPSSSVQMMQAPLTRKRSFAIQARGPSLPSGPCSHPPHPLPPSTKPHSPPPSSKRPQPHPFTVPSTAPVPPTPRHLPAPPPPPRVGPPASPRPPPLQPWGRTPRETRGTGMGTAMKRKTMMTATAARTYSYPPLPSPPPRLCLRLRLGPRPCLLPRASPQRPSTCARSCWRISGPDARPRDWGIRILNLPRKIQG